MGMYM